MKFYSILFILLLVGCANSMEEPPEFDVTFEQLEGLRSKFTETNYDILFLLMVDRKGNVVNSKVIARNKARIDEKTAKRFSVQMPSKFKFSEDKERESEYLIMPYGINVEKKYQLD